VRTLTVRFEEAEAWLVVEALTRFRPDAPADVIKVKRMRDLIEEELGGTRR
jgi:hypothetical protein